MPLRAIVFAVIMYALWGGNTVAIKMSLEAFPPLWTAFFRFLLGVVCVGGWALAIRHNLRPTSLEWRKMPAVSILLTAQIIIMNVGMERTSGVMGSILLATYPLWGSVVSPLLVAGERLTLRRAAGLLVAFSGAVLVLARGQGDATLSIAGVGNAIVLGAAMLLGFRLVWSARVLRDTDNIRLAVWQLLLSLPFLLAGALTFETIDWSRMGWWPISGLLYQGIVIAGIGFTANMVLLKRYSPSAVVSFGFILPISGVLASAWLLGDPLNGIVAMGAVAVAVGLLLVLRGK